MNTLEQHTRAAAKQKAAELKANHPAYIESLGKHDIDTIGRDLDGLQVAVRLVLGATVAMPHRALSYVSTAAHVAQYFPGSQLQIVHANHLGNKINSVNLECARAVSTHLASHTLDVVQRIPELEGRIVHASDTPHDTDRYLDAVDAMYSANPKLAEKMHAKGAKHGGDTSRYTAAHYAFQDTDELELSVIEGASQTPADVIISVGCQQERNFYTARMGMRACLVPSVQTAQIFSKHLTPPYYTARGGEPLLGEVIDPVTIGDPSARRDITHHISVVNGGVL